MKGSFRHSFAAWRGSTLQAIAVIVLPLTFLLVAVSFGSYFIHQNAMRSMVGERDERAVRAAASAIDSGIDHRVVAIHGLAMLAEDGSKDNLAHALSDSRYLLDEFDLGLAFFAPDGSLLDFEGESSFWNNLPAQDSTKNVTSLTVNGQPVVLVSFPTPNGNVVAAGAFTASSMLQGALEKDFPENGNAAVYVFDPQYRTLYQRGPGTIETDPEHHPGIKDALGGKSGATYVQTPSDEHVLAYGPVSTLGWAIVIEESWEAVANPTLQTSQITPMVLIPALLLLVLALWFGAEQIVKPLRSLEAKAAKLAWGDFKEIEQPVQGIVEIRHLQNELVHMARQVQSAQQSLHSYIGAITLGQEEERRRLARELHDDTIQALIALKQRVQLTHRALPQDSSLLPSLDELESLTEQTIEDLRRTIRALRPIYLEDLGLSASLEMLASEISHNSQLKVEFQAMGVERRLGADVELALYRMAQEAVSNAVHHAQATQASIDIQYAHAYVQIQISDNGIGFNVPASPAEFAPAGHFGLLGLYERAELIGADLEITSAPGKGTQITISLTADSQIEKARD